MHLVQRPTSFLIPSESNVFGSCYAILSSLLFMTDTCLKCNFTSADSSVVPGTLIELFLSTCYSQWLSRTCIVNNTCQPSFQSLHLWCTVTAILICQSCVSFATFPTLWLYKSDRRPLHLLSALSQWSCHVRHATVLQLFKIKWKPARCQWGEVHTVYISHMFSVLSTSLLM
jgi:hypothetical protein